MRQHHPFPPDRRNDVHHRFEVYQCLYCRLRITDRFKLPAHEAICEAREVVQRQWQYRIDKARGREADGR